eukprot:g2596.t1
MAERYRALVSELNSELSSKKLLLENQERTLAAERDRLAQEKETMQRIPVSDIDLVYLNVGGRIITTKRGALRMVEGSVLDLMFNGRWEDRIERDSEGRVFLDYDPELFTVILRYLSAIHTYGMAAEHLEIRPIPSHLESEFRLMLEHLGLMQLIQPKVVFKWSPVFKSPDVELIANETIASANGMQTLRHFVLSDSVFTAGLFKFQIVFDLLEEWSMIGVMQQEVILQPTEDSCLKQGVYGFGSNGEVFVNGIESSKDGYPGRKFHTGDRLMIILDCRYSTLVLKAPIKGVEVEYKISNLHGEGWRLLLSTYFGSSTVSVYCP